MGIVEEIGTVVENSLSDSITMWDGTSGPGWLLTINARTVLEGAYNGCSIAVNGVCLTVIRFTESQFTVGLAPETLLRTNLGDAAPGGLVNLERSMRADSRISGHNVQGHVDGTGTILVRTYLCVGATCSLSSSVCRAFSCRRFCLIETPSVLKLLLHLSSCA
jgi:riboflavin synthase